MTYERIDGCQLTMKTFITSRMTRRGNIIGPCVCMFVCLSVAKPFLSKR